MTSSMNVHSGYAPVYAAFVSKELSVQVSYFITDYLHKIFRLVRDKLGGCKLYANFGLQVSFTTHTASWYCEVVNVRGIQ